MDEIQAAKIAATTPWYVWIFMGMGVLHLLIDFVRLMAQDTGGGRYEIQRSIDKLTEEVAKLNKK